MSMLSHLRTLVLALPLAGCAHRQLAPIEILPVPPKDSRWEGDKPDHLTLPLNQVGRAELETQLRFGLSHANEERNSAVEPNAAGTYKPCLDLLEAPHKVGDLSGGVFQKCFQGDIVQQVVDAREAAFARSHAPVAIRGALSDGKYWWVFYRDSSDRLTGVMVIKLQALTRLVEKKR